MLASLPMSRDFHDLPDPDCPTMASRAQYCQTGTSFASLAYVIAIHSVAVMTSASDPRMANRFRNV